MKTYFNIIFSIGVILTFMGGCTNIDDFNPYLNSHLWSPSQVRNSLVGINNTISEFTINPQVENVLKLNDGSQITFPKNCFTDKGNNVNCNILKVKVVKVQNKDEMMQNGVGTNTVDGKLLVSAGMVEVRVFCEDTELQLAKGKKYSLKLVYDIKKFNDDLEMFYAETNADGNLDWFEADNNVDLANNVNINEWQSNSGKFFVGIECFPERLGWVNCDYFLKVEKAKLVTSCIEILTDPTGDKIDLNSFCIFKELNTALYPCCIESENNKFCFKNLPLNEKVIYIVVGKGTNGYYLGFSDATISNTINTSIKLERKTLDEIKKYLSTLK